MKHRHLTYLSIILIVALATSAGCGSQHSTAAPTPDEIARPQATATAEPFDQQTTLEKIAKDLILPWHSAMVAESNALAEAVDEFVAAPTVESLSGLQEQWRAASMVWAKLELLDFRFTLVLRSQIKKWPANIELIEELIAEADQSDDDIDDDFVAAQGSHVKGLAAIEYLLFDPALSNVEMVDKLSGDSNRLAYLVGLIHELSNVAAELERVWLPDGGNQIQAFTESTISNSGVEGSFHVMLHAIIVQMEIVERNKIGIPLRGDDAYAKPDAVESPYANYSIPLVVANLDGITQLMEAGLYDYLIFVESHYVSSSVVSRIKRVAGQSLAALEQIDEPLALAVLEDPTTVAAAWEEIKGYSRRLEVDMANHVGLAATFGVNDGD